MRPFLTALMLCSMTAHVSMLVVPYQATALPVPEKIITVSVCLPERGKDQSRMAMGLLLPKPVTTTKYIAENYPPATQTSDHRKRRKK